MRLLYSRSCHVAFQVLLGLYNNPSSYWYHWGCYHCYTHSTGMKQVTKRLNTYQDR